MATPDNDPNAPKVDAKHTAGLIRAVQQVFDTRKFGDLVIECNGREWTVHRNIVCIRSQFFDNMCNSEFKEARENHVKMTDDDPEAVEAMICYIYGGQYLGPMIQVIKKRMAKIQNAEKPPTSDHQSAPAGRDEGDYPDIRSTSHPLNSLAHENVTLLPLHAGVFLLADKCLVDGLGDIALEYFEQTTTQFPDCVLTGYFQEAARIIYAVDAAVTVKMRRTIAYAIAVYPKSFDQSGGMSKLLIECPELGRAVLVRYREIQEKRRRKCETCRKK